MPYIQSLIPRVSSHAVATRDNKNATQRMATTCLRNGTSDVTNRKRGSRTWRRHSRQLLCNTAKHRRRKANIIQANKRHVTYWLSQPVLDSQGVAAL